MINQNFDPFDELMNHKQRIHALELVVSQQQQNILVLMDTINNLIHEFDRHVRYTKEEL